MNKIEGKILEVKSHGNLSLVEVETPISVFCAVVVETPKTAKYLKKGNSVYILFKETEVSVGKNFHGEISLRNRIEGTVAEIQEGKILSRIIIKCGAHTIRSVITTKSLKRMNIKKGDNITAFIKTNEVSLMEITDGK